MPFHIFPAILTIKIVGLVVVRKALLGQLAVVPEERCLAVLQEPRTEAAAVQVLMDHQINHVAFADGVAHDGAVSHDYSALLEVVRDILVHGTAADKGLDGLMAEKRSIARSNRWA
jgi:hypothetical protein